MDIRFNETNKIHIANKCNQDILVIATSNKDWIPADIGFSFVKSAVVSAITGGSGGGAEVAQKAGYLLKTIKTIKDLYGIYSKLQKVYKVLDSVSQKHMETKNEYVKELLKKSSILIPRNDYKIVNQKNISPFEDIKPLIPKNYEDTIENVLGKGWGKYANSATLIPQIANNIWTNIDPSILLSQLSVVGDITLFIATSDFSKICTFNTNSDHSWIITENEIIRSKYGTVFEEDRSLGWQFFSNTLGQVLCSGEFMEPYDSIDIQTVNYLSESDNNSETKNLLTDNDTNSLSKIPDDEIVIPLTPSNVDESSEDITMGKVISKVTTLANEAAKEGLNKGSEFVNGVLSATKTIGSSPYKLIYLPNGNLSLYKISGDEPTEVWSSNTKGTSPGKAIMQSDGNFVIKDSSGNVVWALWKEIPELDRNEDAFIGFDSVSGRIGYFLKDMKSPYFMIDEKLDIYRRE